MSEDTDSVADDLLRAGYQRWLRLEEEKAAIGDDLKELFAEYKGHGFVSKALRESFRRARNIDDADQQEHDAVVDLYVTSLTRGTRAYTRESGIPSQGATVRRAPAPTRPAESRGDEISAPIHPASQLSAAADGQRSTPSDPDDGAKSEGVATALAGGAGIEPGVTDIQGSQAVTNSESPQPDPPEALATATDAPPPASVATPFLAKASGTMQDDRPHCHNPSACGAYKRGHCYTCSKAAGLNEAAA